MPKVLQLICTAGEPCLLVPCRACGPSINSHLKMRFNAGLLAAGTLRKVLQCMRIRNVDHLGHACNCHLQVVVNLNASGTGGSCDLQEGMPTMCNSVTANAPLEMSCTFCQCNRCLAHGNAEHDDFGLPLLAPSLTKCLWKWWYSSRRCEHSV